MSPDWLDAIEARANAATEGPWECGPVQHFAGAGFHTRYCGIEPNLASGVDPVDAEFIAHARTDVPVLVAEVRRLDGMVARLLGEGRHTDRTEIARLRSKLDSIRELHRPIELYPSVSVHADQCHAGHESDHFREDVNSGSLYCSACPSETCCDTCHDEDGIPVDWPCPTIAALDAPTQGGGDSNGE